MTGSYLVIQIAGLLIITSMLVIIARRPTTAAWLYSLQSLVLVATFIALGHLLGADELYKWSISAFVTKVVLVPGIMLLALRKMDRSPVPPLISTPVLVAIAVVIVLISFAAVEPVTLPMNPALKPVLAISLGHFLLGILCIVSQRNILKQIFGYCLMENGAHLTLALLAYRAPELVEIGIATDSIFAVIVMVLMVRKIYRTLNTLDVRQLTQLKG
ncbi:hydrogenase 4 membrane subunit [Celerinatantimonas diazotrophica]|uniref:Hydrogenase-4 component E n=1 Tax=Celerinatantimonas diazotrophica TaxID=412034 RepID=A0A4R1KB25_9GAMM|nr:hydrogenase 4 membrane subunit [Celerinatantimonas diazotrophica]TCK61113.1 hydrogenase-4 component E [Celerinatantimonas diazotrophica]CAG9295162.1 Hydrogenase-4 component E [Celerinatantimonas diazotrophica]